MALLDHQVPEEAKQVTVDLLQKCVGSMCVVKFWNKEQIAGPCTIACGMIASIVVTPSRALNESQIMLYQSATDSNSISGDEIVYIYSLSMLPGAIPPDMEGFMGPPA